MPCSMETSFCMKCCKDWRTHALVDRNDMADVLKVALSLAQHMDLPTLLPFVPLCDVSVCKQLEHAQCMAQVESKLATKMVPMLNAVATS